MLHEPRFPAPYSPSQHEIELAQLVHSIPSANPDAVRLACLLHISRRHLSSLSESTGSDLTPIMALADDCVSAYITHHGIAPEPVWATLQALQRAQTTFDYLASIPD